VCPFALFPRLDIGFVLNVADDIRNFFEFEAAAAAPPSASSASWSSSPGRLPRPSSSGALAAAGQRPSSLPPARRTLVYCKLGERQE
jgi:hypothetical protein